MLRGLPKAEPAPGSAGSAESAESAGATDAPDAAGAPQVPAPAKRPTLPRRWKLPGVRTWAALCVLAPLAALLPYAWLNLTTLDQRVSPGAAEARPVAIVLGAGLEDDGRPTIMLARRLDIAAELFRTDRAKAVLVSGDNGRVGYNEPDAMRAYLVDAGVPRSRIVTDYAGFSTWETCSRARHVFGVESASLITQHFHLPRAVKLCSRAGIDTQGVGDSSYDARNFATAYGYVREVPASFMGTFEALVRPEPQFAGPEETGIRDALE